MKHVLILLGAMWFTYNLSAQCLDKQAHNTSLFSSWLSCQQKVNPFINRGLGHWIYYEFDDVKIIDKITIWNLNHPQILDSGAKQVQVDISKDGVNFRSIDTLQVSRGLASFDYTGETFDDFEAFKAKYISLTILENYGGECTGLSEVSFNLGDSTTPTEEELISIEIHAFPNPFSDRTDIKIEDVITQKVRYQLVDVGGRVLLRKEEDVNSLDIEFSLSGKDLPEGNYVLNVDTDEGSASRKLLVVHPD